jgi:MFS family permease
MQFPAGSPGSEDRQFPYWRANLRVIPLSHLLASLGFSLSWPFLPLMLRSLGVESRLETWVGNVVLLFYVVSFVMNPLWGGIADYYGRKIMMLRALFGMGFFMVLAAFAPSPLWFAFLLCLVGVFNGNSGAGNAMIVANTPPSRMGMALALTQMGMLVGQTLGPAAGAVLAPLFERQHVLFLVSGGLLLTGGVLVALFAREVKQLAPGKWRLEWVGPLRQLLAVPKLGLLFMLAFLSAMMWNGNVTIVSLYALELVAARGAGAEAFWVGAAALALAVAGLVAMPLWGKVLDRYPPGRVLTLATAAAVVTHVPLLFLETPLQLVLARAAFGLTSAAMQPAIVRLVKEYSPPGMDARAISYAISFHFIAMGLAPFCAGVIAPVFGLRAYFALTVVLAAAGLALWMRGGWGAASR